METAEVQGKQRNTFALEQILRNGAKEFKVLSYSNVSMSLGNHTALSETIFRSNSEINVLMRSQYPSPLILCSKATKFSRLSLLYLQNYCVSQSSYAKDNQLRLRPNCN